MCGSCTVTTALEGGRESQGQREKGREGGTGVAAVVVVGDESGSERKEECERMLCVRMVARATKITTKGCSQLPRIPQRLASTILSHVVCFQEAGTG